jgi:hypothetical protein
MELAAGFSGSYTGEIYSETALAQVDAVAAGKASAIEQLNFQAKFPLEDTNWLKRSRYGKTTYATPRGQRAMAHFHVEDLRVASWEDARRLYDDAAGRATKLWQETHPGSKFGPVTHMEYMKFENMVDDMMRTVMQEAGFDAVATAANTLTFFDESKLVFQRAYLQGDLDPRTQLPKTLAEAMQGASERFAAVHTFMDDYVDTLDLRRSEVDSLKKVLGEAQTQYWDVAEMWSKAPLDSVQRQRLSDMLKEADANIKKMEKDLKGLKDSVGDMTFNLQQNLRAVLPTGSPADVTFKYTHAPYGEGKMGKRFDTANTWLKNTINGDVFDESYPVDVRYINGRAKASGKAIYIDPHDETGIIIHEVGHVMETYDPHIHLRSTQFLQTQAVGPETFWLGDSYDQVEIGVKGPFFDKYVGKVYGNLSDPYATEVFSMGLQYLYEDPAYLFTRHTDHFDLIVGLLNGWI